MRLTLLCLLATISLIGACNSTKRDTGFTGNNRTITKTPPPTPAATTPGTVPNISNTSPPPAAVGQAVACSDFSGPSFKNPGVIAPSGAPTFASGSTRSYNGPDTVLDVTSSAYGAVAGHLGTGVWCLTSNTGEGSNGGPLYADADGLYSQKVPLFCGQQTLVLGFGNAAGKSALVIPVERTACERGGMKLTLTWGAGARDLEAHLIRPGGKLNNTDAGDSDCTWTNAKPAWGCIKDIDWQEDRGTENITLTKPADGVYEVYVEYWATGIPTAATVTINANGQTTNILLPQMSPYQVTHVAQVTWPSGVVSQKNDLFDCTATWASGCKMPVP